MERVDNKNHEFELKPELCPLKKNVCPSPQVAKAASRRKDNNREEGLCASPDDCRKQGNDSLNS